MAGLTVSTAALVVALSTPLLKTARYWLPFRSVLTLGDGQEMVYLPLGLLGFIVMSYLGSVADRSKRGLYRSISWSETRTFWA